MRRSAIVLTAFLIIVAVAHGEQQPGKKKTDEEKAAEKKANLEKFAKQRDGINFKGHLYKSDAFRKLCKPVYADEFANAKADTAASILGVPTRKIEGGWAVATKRSKTGWDDGVLSVAVPKGQDVSKDELTAFFGRKTGDESFEAFMVAKPTGDDLGLTFRYEIRGDSATIGGKVQKYEIVGEVTNAGRASFTYVEVEARLEAAGDSDAWFAFVRDLKPKSKKAFSISLSSFQFDAVSPPKFEVYIKDVAY